MKRSVTIEGLFNISQLAQFLAASALPSCSERTAWKWVNKHRRTIPRHKRGGIVFFKTENAVTLASHIREGKATL